MARSATAFRLPLQSFDETLLLLYPEQMSHGRVPNVDFYTVYGSTGFRFLELWYTAVGPSVTAERAIGFAYHFAILAGVVIVGLRSGRAAAAAAGGVSLILLPHQLAAYAWLGGLALLVWSLILCGRATSRSWFLGGLLGGLAAGWRYEFVFVVVLSLLPLVWRHRRAGWVLMGLVLGWIPTLLHFAVAKEKVWDNVGARATLNFRQDVGSVAIPVLVGLTLCVAAVVVLVINAVLTRQRWDSALALLGLGLLPQGLQRLDEVHLSCMACVVLPLAVSVLVRALVERHRFEVGSLGLAIILVMFVVTWAVHNVQMAAESLRVERQDVVVGNTAVGFRASSAPAIAATVGDLQRLIPRGGEVFVGVRDLGSPSWSPMPIYWVLRNQYRESSYFLELAPGVSERDGSGLAADLRQADALILSDASAQARRQDLPHLPAGFTANNRVVQRTFRPVVHHGPLWLYVRRDRPALVAADSVATSSSRVVCCHGGGVCCSTGS